jgi:hypothetical protein
VVYWQWKWTVVAPVRHSYSAAGRLLLALQRRTVGSENSPEVTRQKGSKGQPWMLCRGGREWRDPSRKTVCSSASSFSRTRHSQLCVEMEVFRLAPKPQSSCSYLLNIGSILIPYTILILTRALCWKCWQRMREDREDRETLTCAATPSSSTSPVCAYLPTYTTHTHTHTHFTALPQPPLTHLPNAYIPVLTPHACDVVYTVTWIESLRKPHLWRGLAGCIDAWTHCQHGPSHTQIASVPFCIS